MASMGGGVGGGGVPTAAATAAGSEATTVGGAQVNGDGTVEVGGQIVDLATAEGTKALVEAVDAEELSTIKGLLQLKEADGPDGPVLVANDRFQDVDTSAVRKQLGPGDGKEGADALDGEINGEFEKNGIPGPFNGNTTGELQRKMSKEPGFNVAVSAMKAYLQNPTKKNMSDAVDRTARLAMGSSAKTAAGGTNEAGGASGLKTSTASSRGPLPGSGNDPGAVNVMELLFLVFKESIKETNEDKKYFLKKLKDFNKMGEALSDYLSELVEVSRDLGARAAGQKYPEMVTTTATIKKFDTSSLNKDGNMQVIKSEFKPGIDRAGLNDTIKEVEAMQETVRNKRQMASTAFQNFDQKANQLYNLMSSVMKAMNEMRMGTTRNML